MTDIRPKLAIIGCGAIAEGMHLPSAAASDQVEVAVLVDKNLARAQELADRYGVPAVTDDYHDIAGAGNGPLDVDAAIVALPNHLHAPVTIDLLRRGIHVLVEKPMGMTERECDPMIEAAQTSGKVLAVGLVRRFYHASVFVKRLIEDGWLGEIKSFDCREGTIYRWAIATDSRFRREVSGGGILIDLGVHVLDSLLWWLGDPARDPESGTLTALEYSDDARGGVEANCEIHLGLESGVSGTIELSRTRDLRNTWIIRGERGFVEFGLGSNPTLHLQTAEREIHFRGQVVPRDWIREYRPTMQEVFGRELDDFISAILQDRPPLVPGPEGKRVMTLIDSCYAARQSLKQPWILPSQLSSAAAL